MPPRKEPIRGKQLKIIAGKYYDNDGVWINDMGYTDTQVHVLVKLKSSTKLRVTRINKTSVADFMERRVPRNYDEAVLDQHISLRKNE